VSKPRQRVRLEAGLKLELYQLMRQRCVVPDCHTVFEMSWTTEQSAVIEVEMRQRHEGYFRIQMQDLQQTIILTSRARSFGGHQWYFVCPAEVRRCSVLWRPPGAREFRCRQGWGGRVAYASQFLDAYNRAYRGQAKIKARLIADLDPDEWELPPKPKKMRWSTYKRLAHRFDSYEEILDRRVAEVMQKLLGKYSQQDQ
jgi:hypothetical protein